MGNCNCGPFVCNDCTLCKFTEENQDPHCGYRILLCLINLILTPVFLIYHMFDTYILPCIGIFCKQGCFYCFTNCCMECSFLDCISTNFHDAQFPPDASSLGNLQTDTSRVKWIRVKDLFDADERHSRLVLFDEDIAASDVCQGALGDCWLLAAFATLCERKAYIQNCFVTTAYNPFGKYWLRLYDQQKKAFVKVVVDDYIPCDHNGKPLFTQFNGHEMWPLLLEKAYAKFKGSYSAIEGGIPVEGMKDLTGYEGESLWQFDETAFSKLKHCIDKGCLLAAGSKGRDNTRVEGRGAVKSTIVGGHAYSILDIKSPHLTLKNIHIIKLRNPWGTFEWDGDWGDSSPLWDKHTGVAFEIGKPKDKEDGVFYMSWEDFIKYFDLVDILYPHFGQDNIHLRIVEEDAWCGTCRGCAWGICKYWLMCKGVRTLWWEKPSAQLHEELDKEGSGKFLGIV